MAQLTDDQRKELIAATSDAAASLYEDLLFLTELTNSDTPRPDEIRRMSAVLRRILVERDLAIVAAPRIGKVNIRANDLQQLYVAARRQEIGQFYSGHATVFGIRLLSVVNYSSTDGSPSFDPSKQIDLPIDTFLKQRVICLGGEWVTRSEVIKYIANVAQGVHSGSARSPADNLVRKMRSRLSVALKDNIPNINLSSSGLHEPDLALDRSGVDCGLIELLAAAGFVVNSPDVITLVAKLAGEA